MSKLAFHVSVDSVALIDSEDSRLWVVFTLEQYVAVCTRHGRFEYEELRLAAQALRPQAPEVAHLDGFAAGLLSDALIEVVGQQDRPLSARLPQGIGYATWRWGENVSAVVYRNSLDHGWFAVVHALPQLQQLQRRFFPTEPFLVPLIQAIVRLPQAVDEAAFMVEGAVALACLEGCAMRNFLT